MATTIPIPSRQLFIDGEWREPVKKNRIPVINPATEQIVDRETGAGLQRMLKSCKRIGRNCKTCNRFKFIKPVFIYVEGLQMMDLITCSIHATYKKFFLYMCSFPKLSSIYTHMLQYPVKSMQVLGKRWTSRISCEADYCKCPYRWMSGTRMKIAGRFKPCAHMGCFDLEVFVQMNQRSRKWQCPICLKNYALENVIIDPYFTLITTKMRNCGEDVTEIEVKPDGSWRVKAEKGIVGGGIGTLSKHRKVHGLANMSATYATNLAIVTGCYCGAREIVRSRHSEPDDIFDSAIAGFGTGALLGRLQGGVPGVVRYSIGIAIVGTGIDYAAIKLRPVFKNMYESVAAGDEKKDSWFKWPEWLPIQVLDEEA